ncbi:MAG: PAS-domain containing protein, partial [Rhodospirillales bacterium]
REISEISTAAHLAEVAELVDVAICAWDADFRIVYLNDRYRKLIDTAPENLYVGMKLEDLVGMLTSSGTIGIVTDKKALQHNIDQLKNLTSPTVSQHVSKTGRLYERHRHPLKNGGGCVLLRDVTPGQGAPLPGSAEFLTVFLHYHPDGCALYDPDDRLVACNALFAKLYGAMPEDLIGLHFAEIIAVGDRNNVGIPPGEEGVLSGMTTPRCRLSGSEQTRFGIRSRDGRHFLVQENLLPSGHVLTFRTDVTDIRATENALRRSAETAGTVNRLARIGSWTLSAGDWNLDWSDEQFRLYGYEPGEVKPTREIFQSHLHPDDRHLQGRTIEASAASHD